MQGQRKIFDSYPNAVDFEKGVPSDDKDINQSAPQNDLNMQSSPHSNWTSYAGVDQDVRMLRGKGSGEPSSSSKAKTVVVDDGLKMEQGWPYSVRTGPGSSSRPKEAEFERSTLSFPTTSAVGHNVCSTSSHGALIPHGLSNYAAQRTDLNPVCTEDSHKHWQALRENVFSNLIDDYKGTTADPITQASFDHFGSSSGTSSYSLEEMDGSGSSIGCWGQSSKRKLHEGSSSQSYPSSTTGTGRVTHNQDSFKYGEPCNSSFDAVYFPLNPYLSLNRPAGDPAESDASLPLHADEDESERSMSNFYNIRNMKYSQDCLPFDSSFDENARRSNVLMFESSSQLRSSSGPVRLRSGAVVRSNLRSPQIASEDMCISHPSNGVQSLRHSGNSVSRSGDSLTLRNSSPNTGLISQHEDRVFISATEPRNLGQDPTNWSLATGPGPDNPVVISSLFSSSPSSRSRPLSPPPPWIRQQNPSHVHQRLPGIAPWTLFPSFDNELRNQRTHSPPLSSFSTSSSPEAVSSRPSSHNVQQAHRRLGSLSDRENDDVIRLPLPLRETAGDMEGRRMLFSEIRQVLGAVRRGGNLQIEDYMLFDPYIYHGLSEIHDRHRDMRLDVDNMSYEELLALEEHIGDVNTGLSEEIIRKLMKQRKYVQVPAMTSPDVEPCCVCQEEFLAGEDLGKLDCGHDFHVHCIKQWLMLKNICPICKTTGLTT